MARKKPREEKPFAPSQNRKKLFSFIWGSIHVQISPTGLQLPRYCDTSPFSCEEICAEKEVQCTSGIHGKTGSPCVCITVIYDTRGQRVVTAFPSLWFVKNWLTQKTINQKDVNRKMWFPQSAKTDMCAIQAWIYTIWPLRKHISVDRCWTLP